LKTALGFLTFDKGDLYKYAFDLLGKITMDTSRSRQGYQRGQIPFRKTQGMNVMVFDHAWCIVNVVRSVVRSYGG